MKLNDEARSVRQRPNRVRPSELVVPPEAGMDFSEYALRAWVIQGAQFTVKNTMGEMRIDGGVRRVLQMLDNERQRYRSKRCEMTDANDSQHPGKNGAPL